MAKYEFTQEQVQALSVFLGRTQLQGSEVEAFSSIIDVLRRPIEEDDE